MSGLTPREEWNIMRPLTAEETARGRQLAAILEHEGVAFNAAGMTRAAQVWHALEDENPITPVINDAVVAWMEKFPDSMKCKSVTPQGDITK